MSHFLVIVISNEPLDTTTLGTVLLPWRSFEYDDVDSKYVVEINETEKLRAEFQAGPTRTTGSEPSASMSFRQWAERRTGNPVVSERGVIVSDAPGGKRYGWIVVDATGEVIDIIKRTNPNAKWDWYQVGGCFSGQLIVNGIEVDEARFSDLDIKAMRAARISRRRAMVEEIFGKTTILPHDRDTALSQLRAARERADELGVSCVSREQLQDWMAVNFGSICAELWRADRWRDLDDVTGCISDWIEDAPYLSCQALVRNGQWLEAGDSDEHWRETVARILGELSPDEHICIVDCHF